MNPSDEVREEAQPSAGAGMSGEDELVEQLDLAFGHMGIGKKTCRNFIQRAGLPLIRTYVASREELASAAMLEQACSQMEALCSCNTNSGKHDECCQLTLAHKWRGKIRSLGSTNALAEALREARTEVMKKLNGEWMYQLALHNQILTFVDDTPEKLAIRLSEWSDWKAQAAERRIAQAKLEEAKWWNARMETLQPEAYERIRELETADGHENAPERA